MLKLVGVAVFMLTGAGGQAVIFYGTENPDHNTVAPAGALAGSGWQFLGDWGVYLGTVIGPRHFITARHGGGDIGQGFHYRGKVYRARACYELGAVDLCIWEVCGQFPPPFAPLYQSDDETGKPLVVFGRGTARGEAVWLDTPNGQELRGWLPGKSDNRRRWGENRVTTIIDWSELDAEVLPGELQYLVVDFDRGGGFNEAHLSVGDSGGAVFIRDAGRWALAGVNHAVEGPFNTVPEGEGFMAVLFDAGGFYLNRNKGDWTLLRDGEEDLPSAFYSTRISTYLDGIRAVLEGEAEPERCEPLVVSSPAVGGPYRPEPRAHLETSSQTIAVPSNGERRFYRLQGCVEYAVEGLFFRGETVVLRYRLK